MTTHLRKHLKNAFGALGFSLLTSALFAQNAPTVTFQKTVGSASWDEPTQTIRTADGGTMTVGYSYGLASGDKSENNFNNAADTSDIWVVKLDAAGNLQWENTIIGNHFDGAQAVQQTSDGGYLVGGTSASGIAADKTAAAFGNFDYWIIKLDANGTIQWQRTYGGLKTDVLQDLIVTSDGGFIAAGYSESGIGGNKSVASLGNNDMWVIKFDANGVEQWQKALGTIGHDIVNEIKKTSDGGYVLGGHLYGYSGSIPGFTYYGAYDFLVVKIDAAGNVQWQKAYGGSGDDYIESLAQTTDGGYILGGYSTSKVSGIKTEDNITSYLGDYWIVKIDAAGNVQWQNTIGGSNMDWLKNIAQTPDGGYIMGGYAYSGVSADKLDANLGDADVWVVKTNSVGSVQWQKTLGGSGYDCLVSLEVVDEGNGNFSYLMGVSSNSDASSTKSDNSKGENDYWIVKLSDPGDVNAPSVTDLAYCPNAAAQPLTAIGQNLLWYTTATGGVGSPTAPTPNTTTPGVVTHYVSQTVNNVESPRVAINTIIKTPPPVTISGLGTMCAGTSQTISAAAGVAFVWNDGVTSYQRVIAPTATTTYSVTVTGANGCLNSGSRTFIVNPTPNAAITAPTAVCSGTSTTLVASGGGTYRWSTGATASSISVIPYSTTTYTVTVTQGSCSKTASRTITTNGVSPLSMQIVGLANQYPKNAAPVTLVGTPSGGTFRVNNQISTTFNPGQLSVGNHSVNYRITQGGCTSNIFRTVSVVNPPSTSNLVSPNQTAFEASWETKRVKLEWANNAGDKNAYFVVQKMDASGEFVDVEKVMATPNAHFANVFTTFDNAPTEGVNTYRVQTILNDGTTFFSAVKSLNYRQDAQLALFPNPATDFVSVNLEDYVGKPVDLSVYNQVGQIVARHTLDAVSTPVFSLDLNAAEAGAYIIRVSSKGHRDEIIKFNVVK